MNILKSNSDGEILRAASGEILTKSDALIDLRSTYGIAKDASNNLLSWKRRERPQVMRPIGVSPIVNDGIEFFTTGSLKCNNAKSIYLDTANEPLFIGFWFKQKTSSTQVICFFSKDGLISDPWFFIYFLNATTIAMQGGDSTVNTYLSIPHNYDNEWHYCSLQFTPYGTTGHYLIGAIDGMLSAKALGVGVAFKENGYFELGARAGSIRYNGYLDDFQIYKEDRYKIDYTEVSEGNVLFIPPERSSE